jgi:hypothetical protein
MASISRLLEPALFIRLHGMLLRSPEVLPKFSPIRTAGQNDTVRAGLSTSRTEKRYEEGEAPRVMPFQTAPSLRRTSTQRPSRVRFDFRGGRVERTRRSE